MFSRCAAWPTGTTRATSVQIRRHHESTLSNVADDRDERAARLLRERSCQRATLALYRHRTLVQRH